MEIGEKRWKGRGDENGREEEKGRKEEEKRRIKELWKESVEE